MTWRPIADRLGLASAHKIVHEHANAGHLADIDDVVDDDVGLASRKGTSDPVRRLDCSSSCNC